MLGPEIGHDAEAFLGHHEDPVNTDLEKARKMSDLINSLQTDLPNGGWLSTLVWNTRNSYLGMPRSTFPAEQMQMVCEGFLTEIEELRVQISNAETEESHAVDLDSEEYRTTLHQMVISGWEGLSNAEIASIIGSNAISVAAYKDEGANRGIDDHIALLKLQGKKVKISVIDSEA